MFEIEKNSESHADKLRELLNTSGEKGEKNSSTEYLRSKHKVKQSTNFINF